MKKNKNKTSFAACLKRTGPADLKALALAFLLPSARDLTFSIGCAMERARFAEDERIFFTVTATTTPTVKVAPRTCRLTGENSQSVRVVDPLDLYPAIAEDGQEKRIFLNNNPLSKVW